jgi:hypothetical protein
MGWHVVSSQPWSASEKHKIQTITKIDLNAFDASEQQLI